MTGYAGNRFTSRLSKTAALLPLPLLVIFTTFHLNEAKGPYWLGTNLDPTYAYLMNSLNIANLHRPRHTDHPGTSVQIAGGLIIRTLNLRSDETATAKNVITSPERYVQVINDVLILFYALCLFTAGYAVLAAWRDRTVFGFVAAGAFLVSISPILTPLLLRQMIRFLFQFATHTGIYGTGQAGFVGWRQYASNVWALIRADRLVFLVSGLGLVLLVLRSRFSWVQDGKYRAVLAVIAAQVLQLLMVATHHPTSRYLIPSLSLVGLNLALLAEVFR